MFLLKLKEEAVERKRDRNRVNSQFRDQNLRTKNIIAVTLSLAVACMCNSRRRLNKERAVE